MLRSRVLQNHASSTAICSISSTTPTSDVLRRITRSQSLHHDRAKPRLFFANPCVVLILSRSIMQVAYDVITAASSSISTKAGSLRQFGRVGAVILGVVSGTVAVSSQVGKREAALKAAISSRDAEIAELKSANTKLEMEKSGQIGKPSSGDPVQDWIDSLAE